VYLSFFQPRGGRLASFVGFGNFVTLANDPIFWQSVGNTIKFTGGRHRAEGHRRTRDGPGDEPELPHEGHHAGPPAASVHRAHGASAPWRGSGSTTRASGSSTGLLVESGLMTKGVSWLGNPTMAMVSIIIVNTWRGLPFFGISILAGLQTIPVELHESATIDGASTWGRFRYVTLPSLLPVILIVTTFSIILTFFDFQLVYVLTGGGPANSTHLMATYAYSLSVGVGQMGLGSAVALSMVPVLGLLLVLLTFYVRKD
jgi:multiple sugar transport system permease protein